ncbi:MAG: hypothetical protein CMJ84_02480 [Planctomycetes bacterium]|jgi:hypothetical protein|nr:hypothetical protein [Planctomycetota bacterium]MDP6408395.1 FG-GAP-like repeat-containing protein [Planctomycetota bacterium]
MKANFLSFLLSAMILVLLVAGASAQQNLHEFHGEAAGDRFGWALACAGDTDGDGIADWLFGSPFSDENGTSSGSARLVSGATGATRYTLHGAAALDLFGYSLACAGDVDGDGFSDLVIGAYGNDDFATEAGTAYVFSGIDGTLLHALSGGEAFENGGISVAGAGDVDGDGLDDVLVGAWGSDLAGPNAGAARVFSGADGSLLRLLLGEAELDLFGTAVCGLGDIDGDGRADLAVGAKWNDVNGSGAGSVEVFSGADGAPLFTLRGAASGDGFGSSVACAGDVDGDGVNDLIVGAPGADVSGTNAGSATVYSGVDGSSLFQFEGPAAGDGFGVSVAGAGDMDGDGRADVIVGAHGNDANGSGAGCARVFSGADGSLISEVLGDASGDRLGFSVDGGGDIDGDGRAEVLVSAYGCSAQTAMSGEARVWSFSEPTACPAPVSYCATNSHSGGSAANLGWTGSASVRANDLELLCTGAVPGQSVMFFYGAGQTEQPFGDGFLCVTGPIFRLSVGSADVSGGATHALDIGSPSDPAGQITLGSTWFFQVWYRDPGGPSGFNLTDALEATFCQ